MVYFILHTFLGSIAIYLLLKYQLKLSLQATLFSSFVFIASPRLAGYLEAGHSGLVASWGLLPWILFAVFTLAKSPKYLWMVMLAISLSGVFFTHTITFLIAGVAAIILFLVLKIFYYTKNQKSSALYFFLGLLSAAGLSAVTLLPQMEWTPQTTRFLLLQSRDVYPKWSGIKEFLGNIFIPEISVWSTDTEKWLALGFIVLILSFIGLMQLKTRAKILLILTGIAIFLISLNNASPLYKLFMRIDWYVLSRVSTRVWFIPALSVVILSGMGIENLRKKGGKCLFIILLIGVALAEVLYLSWAKVLKPLPVESNYVPAEVYQYLNNDPDRFRVFCVERCFSQQEATTANLELIEGYNTLQQTNYYKHMWQLSGGYWNYYTLALPPQGDFLENRLQPNAASLGAYNTKYVLSTYPLKDKNLVAEKQFGNFIIYRNQLFKTRAYFKNSSDKNDEAPILKFSPNYIRIDTSKHMSDQVILAEVYSAGWKAYLNGKQTTKVLETPISLRLINIEPDTKFVDFRYEPDSFVTGRIITIATTFLLICIPLLRKRLKL